MEDTSSFLFWEDSTENPVVPACEASHAYYMLFNSKVTDKLLASAKEHFGDVMVLSREHQPENEIAFITPNLSGKKIEAFVAAVEPEAALLNKIRVLEY